VASDGDTFDLPEWTVERAWRHLPSQVSLRVLDTGHISRDSGGSSEFFSRTVHLGSLLSRCDDESWRNTVWKKELLYALSIIGSAGKERWLPIANFPSVCYGC
jgi:hypothetical protein